MLVLAGAGHRTPANEGRSALANRRPTQPTFGLCWPDDMSAFSTGDKSDWDWRMMIRQPDAVEADLIRRLAEEVAAKKALPVARGLDGQVHKHHEIYLSDPGRTASERLRTIIRQPYVAGAALTPKNSWASR